jgi:hypothetical protein
MQHHLKDLLLKDVTTHFSDGVIINNERGQQTPNGV